MSQSRIQSAIESIAGTAIGFGVAYATGLVVLPAFGFDVTHEQNAAITCIYTAISLVRGFFVRRMFNRLHGKAEA